MLGLNLGLFHDLVFDDRNDSALVAWDRVSWHAIDATTNSHTFFLITHYAQIWSTSHRLRLAIGGRELRCDTHSLDLAREILVTHATAWAALHLTLMHVTLDIAFLARANLINVESELIGALLVDDTHQNMGIAVLVSLVRATCLQ